MGCTLFVVPHSCSLDYASSELLRNAAKSNHEIAQHGYQHTGNEYFSEFGCLLPIPFPTYKKQREYINKGMKKIKEITRVYPKGFRAPFYLHNKNTFRVLSELGFFYDSSKTVFKPAYLSKIRFRTMNSVKPKKINNVLEIPVSGDYTYNLTHETFHHSLKTAIKEFSSIKLRDGVFVMNNHPNRVNIKLLFMFLNDFIKIIKPQSDFLKLSNVKING